MRLPAPIYCQSSLTSSTFFDIVCLIAIIPTTCFHGWDAILKSTFDVTSENVVTYVHVTSPGEAIKQYF